MHTLDSQQEVVTCDRAHQKLSSGVLHSCHITFLHARVVDKLTSTVHDIV